MKKWDKRLGVMRLSGYVLAALVFYVAAATAANFDISPADAIKEFKAGKTLFVDARTADDYRAGHIKGAINIYPEDFYVGAPLPAALKGVAKETPIITYCDGANCDSSQDLAETLRLSGFSKVRTLKNGWTLWKQKKMPTEKGSSKK